MTDQRLFEDPPRRCAWCEGPLPAGFRSDALYCRQRCRQSMWRLGRGRAIRAAGDRRLRLAYADPPYPGKAKECYGSHPDFAGEVDHAALFVVLEAFDGWALSTSADALPDVLALAPAGSQVAAWFRGARPPASYAPLNAWEPVIYRGGRAYLSPVDERRLDALVHHSRPRTSDPRRVIGAKPGAFCFWMFDLLGALPGDELVDLFPGSGGVSLCWDLYVKGGRDATAVG